jgi:hypothetical protein
MTISDGALHLGTSIAETPRDVQEMGRPRRPGGLSLQELAERT